MQKPKKATLDAESIDAGFPEVAPVAGAAVAKAVNETPVVVAEGAATVSVPAPRICSM
jgi:hypothetical protein